MSDASTTDGNDALVQINVRVTRQFLDQIDDTWQGRGFNSRSEYIRHVLHDASEYPTFDRDELLALALGERAYRKGETISREEALEHFEQLDAENEE